MVEISRKSAARQSPIDQNKRNLRSFQSNIPGRVLNDHMNQRSCRTSGISSKYSKKLPISFIAAKDWRLYIHFSGKVRTRGQLRPRNRVQRLLNSFIRLYHEYAYVCDIVLPPQGVQSAEKDMSKLGDDGRRYYNQNFDESGRDSDSSRKACGTYKGIFEDLNVGRFSDISMYGHDYENGQLSRWLTNKLRYFRTMKAQYTMPYDKIKPYQHETIEIYSSEKTQTLISHRISFTGFDYMGRPKIKWIQVPIALELLIPKVQSKIQRVMSSCSFLYDPLEVAAELRYFNYNVDICISHFHKTRKFRDILEGFLPQKSQLKELQSQPHLWMKLKKFLEQISDEEFLVPEPKTPNFHNMTGSNNHTRHYMGQYQQGDHIAKKQYDKLSTERFNSPMHAKLIKVVCSIEKLKLSKADIVDSLIKWRTKYNRQILEYSRVIMDMIESFKDFLMTEEQRGRVIHLLKQNDELKLKLKEEEKKRKTIYNLMQDQMGNVRVYCRCRAVDRHQNVLDIKANDTIMVQMGFFEEYKFDKVFEPFRTQSDIYEEIQPLIMSFIDGFNVCFITYGGEASGKTYTLLGPTLDISGSKDGINKHDGIMKRALRDVLCEQSSRRRDWEYNLTGSVVEIYNDTFSDLLAEKSGIHLPIDGGLDKVQESLKTMDLNCEGDIESLIRICKIKRKVGRTALNPHSSRSHLIIVVHLAGRSKIHGESISSFLGMCDLAGFEDILKAETHNNSTLSKEAGYINKSLTAFNRMFTSLRRQDPNSVSYRDTKLTYLLKPFLTNQGKCILIVTVRTDKSSISSTQSTLRFGRESRGVALGKARRQANHLDKIAS